MPHSAVWNSHPDGYGKGSRKWCAAQPRPACLHTEQGSVPLTPDSQPICVCAFAIALAGCQTLCTGLATCASAAKSQSRARAWQCMAGCNEPRICINLTAPCDVQPGVRQSVGHYPQVWPEHLPPVLPRVRERHGLQKSAPAACVLLTCRCTCCSGHVLSASQL